VPGVPVSGGDFGLRCRIAVHSLGTSEAGKQRPFGCLDRPDLRDGARCLCDGAGQPSP
jgi:hypothetical protein